VGIKSKYRTAGIDHCPEILLMGGFYNDKSGRQK